MSPFFTILTAAYNRETSIVRALRSCQYQTDGDFEVIVINDASTDETANVVLSYAERDPRIRLLTNPTNLGIGPTRNRGATESRGDWVITLDSDWELVPNALARLREAIAQLDDSVGLIGGRVQWDDGRITPATVPDVPIDYIGRMRWISNGGGSDALHCRRRATLDTVNWYSVFRGGGEGVSHLDFCKFFTEVYIDQVLALEHSDQGNSISRGAGVQSVRTFLLNAPDLAALYSDALERHGKMLKANAPSVYADWIRACAHQNLLAGNRVRGVPGMVRYLLSRPGDISALIIMVVGMISPLALARLQVANRRRHR